MFNKWDISSVKVNDLGLQNVISLKPVLVPKTHGRTVEQFRKSNLNIVERLINRVMVPGHRGKKHLIDSEMCTGKGIRAYNIVSKTLEIIENRTGKNPIEVFVRALENSTLREEVTSYQLGGIMVRKAVITSPQRRVDIVLRIMVQGSYQKAHRNKRSFSECLADEIIAAYKYDTHTSYTIKQKERIEREANSAR